MLLFIRILDVAVSEIYSHVYSLHGNVKFSPKSLGGRFGDHVLDWLFERFCGFITLCILATILKFMFQTASMKGLN